jgi:uncharacterized protein YcaQ
MPARRDALSIDEARRIAVAAQGFAAPRPTGAVTQRHVDGLFARLGAVQIDSVNVLVRSQELPLFSRLGVHNRSAIPRATERRAIFEYWGHAAAHLPIDAQPLFRWKMRDAKTGKSKHWGLSDFHAANRRFVADVLRRIRDGGPVTASQLSTRTGPKGSWWDWDEAKLALEYLFLTGDVMALGRGNDFARIYDVAERVLPPHVRDAPTPSEAQARRELVLRAARAQGIATLADLADYFRQRTTDVKAIVAELVSAGEIVPVRVEGWKETAYLARGTKVPDRIETHALLSPFDSLVWFRPRNERLFDFHYRIEIYTPKDQRRFGYYVLPFMMDGALVARVDVKADRERGELSAIGAFGEPGVDAAVVAPRLAGELDAMARWLGLDDVRVGRRGNLATATAGACAALRR